MDTDFAEGVAELESKVDRALNDVIDTYNLTGKECAKELRRIADEWDKEA